MNCRHKPRGAGLGIEERRKNLDDVIVFETGQQRPFRQVAAGPLVDLQRHQPAERGLPSQIDVGQRAFAQKFDDLELTDDAAMARPCLIRQRLRVEPRDRSLNGRPVLVRGTHRTSGSISRRRGTQAVAFAGSANYFEGVSSVRGPVAGHRTRK